MIRATKTGLAVAALAVSTIALATPAADAGTAGFANCTALHHSYKYGVSVSKAAAQRQVNSGHYRPAVRPKVYRANRKSDADHDGTACEVTR